MLHQNRDPESAHGKGQYRICTTKGVGFYQLPLWASLLVVTRQANRLGQFPGGKRDIPMKNMEKTMNLKKILSVNRTNKMESCKTCYYSQRNALKQAWGDMGQHIIIFGLN